MMSPYLLLYVVGAGALALWLDVRFPNLAPQSFMRRVGAALAAVVFLQVAPVVTTSTLAWYLTLFGMLLPAFVAVFVTSVWLLRALRDARPA